ncbi:MAG TPA: hypothetical protein VND65_07195 [Candidatus Binatia bacterium]|nr:hypothetical protein [Candidatus Binatia bacterium]
MRGIRTLVALCVLVLAGWRSWAQQTATAVPMLVNFSSSLSDAAGKPVTATTSVTFSLFQNQQGGAPLWSETQSVEPNTSGAYAVMLGAATGGLPASLFVSGEPRWLEVQAQGETIPPRVMLLSVPYALKAGDAQTIGGLPPSAFVLAGPSASATTMSGAQTASSAPSGAPSSSDVTTTGGTVNILPLFTTATNIQNSAVTQTGSGSTAKIGVGTSTPAATLDVKGGSIVRGTLNLPATGTATAAAGKNSQAQTLVASVFSSSTSAAVPQTFQWQAEPVGNDTSSAGGSLNLLYASGTNKPAETGFHIGSNGQITFAAGQTFPGTGTGNGTVTSVGTGAGLMGGPITSSGTLSIANAGVTNAMLANPSLTIQAGTALTGGGTVSLGGSTTLNIDTTKVALLAASNTFSGNQTANGNLTATGVVTGSSFQIGSNLFDYGSYIAENAFTGFGGNTTMTGQQNTASGVLALVNDTSGQQNTAFGDSALVSNTAGSYNAAGGDSALFMNTTGAANTGFGYFTGITQDLSNMTGTGNTFLGYSAAIGTGSFTNATAIGANAEVNASNAMVLGSIKGVNGATASTSVGIGTIAPGATFDVEAPSGTTPTINFGSTSNPSALTVNGTGKFTGLITFASGQTFPGAGTITAITAGSGLSGGGVGGNVSLNIPSAGINNTMLQSSSLTVNPGTALTGGGAVSLGGTTTLNVDTTKVPLLAASNTFTGNQTMNGNLTATGMVSGAGFQIASNLFDYGSYTNANSFLGFSGNVTLTGQANVGIGQAALQQLTSGGANTAAGVSALGLNTSGSYNVAIGQGALYVSGTASQNTAVGTAALPDTTTATQITGVGYTAGLTYDGSRDTGYINTFVGAFSGPSTGNLVNATAIGAYAEASSSNSLVLGCVPFPFSDCPGSVNVGIGTNTPTNPLTVVGNSSTYIPVAVQSNNTFGTWMTLSNSSTGGSTWNFISAASGNSEGAGNLVLTDFNSDATVYIHSNLHVDGTVSKGGGSFKIDDPLDPANKYLSHSFVESPDMMNIYNGVIVLDAHGSAWITMPEYFEALNRDFRYQLTSMGRSQPGLYVAREMAANRFQIAGGKPGGRVSWQVTGIRHDAYADAHRIPVEEEKPERERGKYLHPELFGAPQQMAIGAVITPKLVN